MNNISNIGGVVWITGLSASGKSTLANFLVSNLKNQYTSIVALDGDDLREIFNAVGLDSSFNTRDSRIELAKKYSLLCKYLSDQGLLVIISTISLFNEIHVWNRSNINNYFEIFLKVPLHELKLRDPKSIYKKFDLGLIKNVAGLDLKIDEPVNSELILEFPYQFSYEYVLDKVLNFIKGEKNEN